LKKAVRWKWFPTNPARDAEPGTIGHAEPNPPSTDELRAILEDAERLNPDLASMLFVAATTGCRRGELSAVRWKNIDWTRGVLTVGSSISDANGDLIIKDTKTHATRRVSLDPATLEALTGQYDRCTERAGTKPSPDADVWSEAIDGSKPWHPNKVTALFRRRAEQTGVDHKLHDLRAFSASQQLTHGVDVRTVAGRGGWSNVSVLMKHYAAFMEESDRKAAVVMGEVAELISPRS
jgi:integrase